ncbi:MAG: hypothetical protein R2852_00760 [Bacteroidia bacterium]
MENNQLLNDKLPYGNVKLFLGIASIVLSPIIVGFILGVISVYLVDKDTKMLNSFSSNYSDEALKNHKQGVLLSWIGFVVSFVVLCLIIVLFYKYGTLNVSYILSKSK